MPSSKQKIHDIATASLRGATLTVEEIETVGKISPMSLIADYGFAIEEAHMIINNLTIQSRKHKRAGFSVSESRKISQLPKHLQAPLQRALLECGCEEEPEEMMMMPFPAAQVSSYHPVQSGNGLEFEDSDNYEESGMIKSNLYSIANKAQSLHDMVKDGDDLPEWVQEKIAVCDEYMDVISDYLKYEYKTSEGHLGEAKVKKKSYGGKKYQASAGSVSAIKKSGGSAKKAVAAGKFDWASNPYAAAQAAHIAALGEPTVERGSKLKESSSKKSLTEAQRLQLIREFGSSDIVDLGLDATSLGLDVIGFVGDILAPATSGATLAISTAADSANFVLNILRGKYLQAVLSFISLIPAIGDIVGKGTKIAIWVEKYLPKAYSAAVKYGPEAIEFAKIVKDNKIKVYLAMKSLEKEFSFFKDHTSKLISAFDKFYSERIEPILSYETKMVTAF